MEEPGGGGEAVLSGWARGVPETVMGSYLCGVDLGSVRLFRHCLSLGNGWRLTPCFAGLLRAKQGRLTSWHFAQQCSLYSAEVPLTARVLLAQTQAWEVALWGYQAQSCWFAFVPAWCVLCAVRAERSG